VVPLTIEAVAFDYLDAQGASGGVLGGVFVEKVPARDSFTVIASVSETLTGEPVLGLQKADFSAIPMTWMKEQKTAPSETNLEVGAFRSVDGSLEAPGAYHLTFFGYGLGRGTAIYYLRVVTALAQGQTVFRFDKRE
jgi:hypothetical protein